MHPSRFDDTGRSAPVAGATVHVGGLTALTDATGSASLSVTPGS